MGVCVCVYVRVCSSRTSSHYSSHNLAVQQMTGPIKLLDLQHVVSSLYFTADGALVFCACCNIKAEKMGFNQWQPQDVKKGRSTSVSRFSKLANNIIEMI